MSTVFRFLLTAIPLVFMVHHAHADTTRDPAEARRAEVVLEAGEIDGSRVDVGAFAVVIHGQGERHPISGEWESLVTVRGYIQAVDAKSLILNRGQKGWLERIAVERIQTLVLVGPPSPGPANGDSTQAAVEVKMPTVAALPLRPAKGDDRETDKRIARKLSAGALGGIVFGSISGFLRSRLKTLIFI
jgi:hypothetical protein